MKRMPFGRWLVFSPNTINQNISCHQCRACGKHSMYFRIWSKINCQVYMNTWKSLIFDHQCNLLLIAYRYAAQWFMTIWTVGFTFEWTLRVFIFSCLFIDLRCILCRRSKNSIQNSFTCLKRKPRSYNSRRDGRTIRYYPNLS